MNIHALVEENDQLSSLPKIFYKESSPMNIHELVEGNDQLPSLPKIFYEVKGLLDDPDNTFEDIAYSISSDPALSARLLRIVNSAFFGFSETVETISHAISIIGKDQLENLILSTLIIKQFQGIPGKLINMQSFWEHSLACGFASRIFAQRGHEPNSERFFVAGLLHDIGRLVLCLKAPEKTRKALHQAKCSGKPLTEAELDVFGFDHGEVGSLLLKKWKLPASHVEVAKFHHRPSEASQYPLETAIVHVADIVANSLEMGCTTENISIPSLDLDAWELIRLPEEKPFSSTLVEVLAQYEEMGSAFLQPA